MEIQWISCDERQPETPRSYLVDEQGDWFKARYRNGQWFTNSKGQKYGIRNGSGAVYLQSEYPHLYYGRGPCQLTWLDNYIKLGKMINVDLANNPDLALEPKNAANILITGMLTGAFTGMSLPRCIKTGTTQEFVNARKIINGTDRDKLIAGYAVKFLDCLIVN